MKYFVNQFLSVNPLTLTVSSTLLVTILFLTSIPILDLTELKTYDLRFLSRGVVQPTPAVVLAVIDEKSLDSDGRWPWPRSKIASLIEILSQNGAKVIGFDVGFLEPDENSRLKYINELERKVESLGIKNSQIADFISESKKHADNDFILANAIKHSSSAVVLGYFFHMSKFELDYPLEQHHIDQEFARVDSSKYPSIIYRDQETKRVPFFRAYAPESNLDMLTKVAESSGYFSLRSDEDGVVRWMPLVIEGGGSLFAPLAIWCAWHYLEQPQLTVRVGRYGIDGIQMGAELIPTSEDGQLLINYLGPPKTFPHISIGDILDGKIPGGTFKDKIVLVGATATGIYDLRSTPFSPVYPGVEIHATVIDNILSQTSLTKPNWTRIYDVLVIILFGTLTGIALPRFNALNDAIFTLGLFVLHIFIARWIFVNHGVWLNIVYPLLVLCINYSVLTVYHYLTEERERKKIKGAFSFYVSSSVVSEMLKNPEKLKLGGDKKDLSVLFSDIRGFTSISEGLTPEDLVHLLNEYLTVMTDIVFKYDGTLDKYMGDAIMAIYGAPLEMPDHPQRACRSALEMTRGLQHLNEKWIREGKKTLDIGIGINTGPMMVGNMGSEQRFDYTVMGDAVNLGSRLEGANKNYMTRILMSEYTYECVKNDFVCMELDCVKVKGKSLPVKIYQLVGDDDVSPAHKAAIIEFHKGLDRYKNQRFDEAIRAFQSVKDLDLDIYSAELYIQRSLSLKEKPPGPNWDGVFTMTTK